MFHHKKEKLEKKNYQQVTFFLLIFFWSHFFSGKVTLWCKMIVQRDNNLDRVTKMKNMKPQQHQLLLEEIETGVYDELDPTHSLGKQEQLENKIKLLQVLFFDDSNVLSFFKTISSPSFSPVSSKIIIKYKPNRFAKTEEETKDKNEEEEEKEIPEEEIPEEKIPEEEIPEEYQRMMNKKNQKKN